MPEFDAIGLIQWRVRAEDEEQAKEILMDAMLGLEASFQASKSNPEGLEFREYDISVLERRPQPVADVDSRLERRSWRSRCGIWACLT